MKRLFLLLTVLVPGMAFAVASPFLDVVGHPHEAQIDLLRTHGIISGYGYGIFRPDIPLNRAEFLKITMAAAYGDEAVDARDTRCFTDFSGGSQWYFAYACSAKERGILDGYPDGTFRGAQQVILAEALKMAVDAWSIPLPAAQVTYPHWYSPYMDIAAARGLLEYFPNNPAHVLTRSEMAYLLVKLGEPIAYVRQDPTQGSSASASSVSSTSSPRPASSASGAQCGNGSLEPGEECDDGNTADGDGCSSICLLVSEPVRHAVLLLEQRIIGGAAVSGGARDVPLLAMQAAAARQEARLTTLSFIAEEGGLGAASNYRLMADVSGDGVVDTIVASAVPQNGTLTFQQLNLVIRQDTTVRLEVWADLLPVDDSTSLGLGFATGNPRYAEAIGTVDGRDLSGIRTDDGLCPQSLCWIAVYTEEPRVVSVVERGNLYVFKDASAPVSSQMLLAGGETADLLRVRFRAVEEDVEVTQVTLEGSASAIDRLQFYRDGQTTSFATATVAACPTFIAGQFCMTEAFTVAADTEVPISVRARLKADTEGAISGQTVTLSIPAGTASSPAIRARGAASQSALAQNDGDAVASGEIFIGRNAPGANSAITSVVNDTAFARIAAIRNDSPDPDNTPVPVGESFIGIFRFVADQHVNTADGLNRATLRRITFRVSAQNVQLSQGDFVLANTLDFSQMSACTADKSTGDITVTCDALHTKNASTVLQAGGSAAFALRAQIVNPAIITGQTSQLQARIEGLSDRTNQGAVVWDDGVTTFSWVNIGTQSVRSTLYR